MSRFVYPDPLSEIPLELALQQGMQDVNGDNNQIIVIDLSDSMAGAATLFEKDASKLLNSSSRLDIVLHFVRFYLDGLVCTEALHSKTTTFSIIGFGDTNVIISPKMLLSSDNIENALARASKTHFQGGTSFHNAFAGAFDQACSDFRIVFVSD